jgi:TRAP-type C4-dicarboxylate transport system permease small subunit
MSKKMGAGVKRRIEIIDRDLHRLRELRRGYCRHMLKIGVFMWEMGVFAFTVAAILWAIDLAPHVTVWLPLLIIALAAPIVISALFIRKLERKERTLEQLRKNLLDKFERGMLKEAEKLRGK